MNAAADPGSVEELGLLRGELLVGQDTLLPERRELLELVDRNRGCGRRRRLVVAALGLVVLGLGLRLAGPTPLLTAGDAVADGRGGSRGDGDAGDAAQ
jgi:hypothetical protein